MSGQMVSERTCAPSDVGFEFTEDAPQELRDCVAAYLSVFDAPISSGRERTMFYGSQLCSCGRHLSGALGTFRWGLAHGEGFCRECKRPARAYHRIADKDGEVASFSLVLLYRLKDTGLSGESR